MDILEKIRSDDINADLLCRDVLVSLRKITQAIDLHSCKLSREYGLTGPQLVILQELSNRKRTSVTELSQSISLSQGTVTDILSRLERKGLVVKRKSETDKRRTEVDVTDKGRQLLVNAPPPLQETFVREFLELKEWEQLMILSSLHRIVDLMQARKIDASPFLVSGSFTEAQAR
ncbi:MAG: MarR family transcriptional regulator [Deltaproteobacteria bacterium]|nr:MarR family transcriptional regulator [Deltaproteobacteria bacterium]